MNPTLKRDEQAKITFQLSFNDAERISLMNGKDGQFFNISKDKLSIDIKGTYTHRELEAILWLMKFSKEVKK